MTDLRARATEALAQQELRSLLRGTQDVQLYRPVPGSEAAWRAAEERIGH